MNKKVYFVHVPKTGGMSVRGAMYLNDGFYPKLKDREHKFGMRNVSRRGSISFPTKYWDCYQDDVNFQNADLKFSVIRNPFDQLLSYYLHDAHGTNKDDGWANINGYMGFKSFEEFIDFYCNCNYEEWHVPMLNVSLYSQLFDDNRKSLVDYVIRFEILCKGLKKIAKISGMNVFPLSHRNKTGRRVEENYKVYYNKSSIEKVKKKLEWDFEVFKYLGSLNDKKKVIIDIRELEFCYKG